jgi:hypothetical protein
MTTIEAEKGDSIYTAARKAIMHAKINSTEVRFVFNEIEIIVSPLSFDIDIVTIYDLKCNVRRLKKESSLNRWE